MPAEVPVLGAPGATGVDGVCNLELWICRSEVELLGILNSLPQSIFKLATPPAHALYNLMFLGTEQALCSASNRKDSGDRPD